MGEERQVKREKAKRKTRRLFLDAAAAVLRSSHAPRSAPDASEAAG